MENSASPFGGVDPRVTLVVMLAGMTIDVAHKVIALIKQNGDDDADLAAILAEAESRLARRTAGE